jgi:hypothetical protein
MNFNIGTKFNHNKNPTIIILKWFLYEYYTNFLLNLKSEKKPTLYKHYKNGLKYKKNYVKILKNYVKKQKKNVFIAKNVKYAKKKKKWKIKLEYSATRERDTNF